MNPRFKPLRLCAPSRLQHFFAKCLLRYGVLCIFLTGGAALLKANVPGAIVSGTSPAVTLTAGSGTVTLSNGIVSILCTESGATITQINYTYNNNGTARTTQLLNAGTDGGELYWEYGGFGGSAATYSVVVNPATGDANHAAGNYAEIDLLSTSSTNGTVDIHFSMLRGSPGFYVTAIWSHRSVDGAMGLGETRTNIYAGSIFNWMSVDSARNKLMEVSTSATSVPVPGAPKECYLWTNGIYQGRYDDKYKYSADFGDQQYGTASGNHRVWGWSSVGTGGYNVGLWDVNPSTEYYNGGPMKRELMCHIGTTILNMFNGDHFFESIDAAFASGELWTKVYGPYFVYCNNVATTVTDPVQASQTLFNDALAQGAAEATGTASTQGAAEGATAWPYGWFVNTSYARASGRSTVTGRIIVSDTGNPNASGSNMMVGLVQQPATSAATYDFQAWMKPYEFFVYADGNGNFSIPNVIAGTNYTLYAFGPGAEGEFMSQNQTGGNPPLLYNLPANPFSVTGTSGSTTSLGNVTWTPTRVGATVFEIGYPDRTGKKFRHGDDYWVGDIGSSVTSPSPVWTKFLEYPFDFPNGMTYNVGTSRWTTDWDFVQPVVTDTLGNYDGSTGTINFTLASAPPTGAQASIYLGLASNYAGPTIVSVNGTNLGSASGVTSVPDANSVNGYFPQYGDCDSTIREGINGMFSDERLTFPGTLLKTGSNTITINMRKGGYFADHIMYDYMRLEVPGYVPPPPSSVTAYAGNKSVLVTWPVTPGATSYNVLRTITSGSAYTTIASGTGAVIGPVCGSGPAAATWLDTTDTNGKTYYYVVQSVNTTGTSADSPQSAGVAPSAAVSSVAPAVPTGVAATAGNGSVALGWTASTGADYYTIQRTTLYNNGGPLLSGSVTAAETYNPLGTITLSNTTTGTTYTDATTTNGSTYAYTVAATNAAGTSSTSSSVNAVPLAPAPTTATVLTATPGSGQVTLNWSAVPGAVGYVVEVATASGGPYTLIASVTELTYVDTGLNAGTTYYFTVQATNSGGSSAVSDVASATTALAPPASLTATPGNTQITLTWPAVTGATSYVLQRSGVTGGPYTTIGTPTGPSYTDNGLTNGTPYFYVVAANNAAGPGATSEEATATPTSTVPIAPLGLTASGSNSAIILKWTASAGATGYIVYRSGVTGGPYSVVASGIDATTYTDSGLSGSTTYYYVVVATDSGGASAYSAEVSATTIASAFLTFTWDNLGASPTDPADGSGNWDTATALWSNGSADSVWSNGGDNAAVFGHNNGAAGTVTVGAITAEGLVFNPPGSGAYTLTSGTLTLSGSTPTITANTDATIGSVVSSSGTYAVTMNGLQTLTFTNPATFTSPVILNEVTVDLSGPSYSAGMLGTGTLTFDNATLVNVTGNANNALASDFDNPVFVGAGETGNIYFSERNQWGPPSLPVTGSGTLNLYINSNVAGGAFRADFYTNFSSFTGQVNLIGTVAGCGLRYFLDDGAVGSTNAQWNVGGAGTTVTVYPQTGSGGNTMDVGALTGGVNGILGGGSGGVATYSLGALGLNTTYPGSITGSVGTGNAAVTKVGAGTQILSGPCVYTGATSVLDGVLEITGTLSSTSSLTVASGAVFYLAGGSLSVSGNITNSGIFKISGTPTLTQTGSFINNGVLDLINGSQTLPSNFTNNGTVLSAGNVNVQAVGKTGTSFSISIQSYLQHTYQLQRSTSLTNPTWTNVGSAQTGTGSTLNFSDSGGATGTQGYYQILISP